MIVKGKLKNGFEYQYDDKVFHYWKMLKLIKAIKSPDTPEAFYDYCLLIFGEKQLSELENHIEKTTGEPATVEAFSDISNEIMQSASEPVKNL